MTQRFGLLQSVADQLPANPLVLEFGPNCHGGKCQAVMRVSRGVINFDFCK